MIYNEPGAKYNNRGITYNGVIHVGPGSSTITTVPAPPMVPPGGGSSGMALSASGDGRTSTIINIYDPMKLREECLRQNVDISAWWGKCNSYTCPVGFEPGIAYLLVDYKNAIKPLKDLAAVVPPTSNDGLLVFWSLRITDVSANTRIIRNMLVTAWRCVSGGNPTDDNSIYMLTMKDARVLFWNRRFSFNQNGSFSFVNSNINGTFNIPRSRWQGHTLGSTAGVGYGYFIESTLYNTSFIDQTLQSSLVTTQYGEGDLWSWSQMLYVSGAYSFVYHPPGATETTLPYTPTLPPIDWDVQCAGYPLAVAAMLDRLSVTLKFNPFATPDSLGSGGLQGDLCVVGKDEGTRGPALDSLSNYLIMDTSQFTNEHTFLIWFNLRIIRDATHVYSENTGSAYHQINRWNGTTDVVDIRMTDKPVFVNIVSDDQYVSTPADAIIGGLGQDIADHDVPMMSALLGYSDGPFTYFSFQEMTDSISQHAHYYRQSILNGREINRTYSGYHTTDALLPGPMMKIVRWSDTGDGPKTHFYCGDGYLPPHALYHLVNPHRYHRQDDLQRFKTIDQIDLTKL